VKSTSEDRGKETYLADISERRSKSAKDLVNNIVDAERRNNMTESSLLEFGEVEL